MLLTDNGPRGKCAIKKRKDGKKKQIEDLSGTVNTNPKKDTAVRVFLRRSDGGIAIKTRVF